MATSIYAFPYVSATVSQQGQQDVPQGAPVERGALNSICPPTMSEQEQQDVPLGHSLAMGSVAPVYPPQDPSQSPSSSSKMSLEQLGYAFGLCSICTSGLSSTIVALHYMYLGASANTTGFSYAGCAKGLAVAGCSFGTGAALCACGLWSGKKCYDKLIKNSDEDESLQPLLMNEEMAPPPQHSIPGYSKE